MGEVIHVMLPAPVFSEDRQTATVGFPDGHPVPLNVRACGDGIHVFKPEAWSYVDDAVCLCTAIWAGLPVLRVSAETILILEPQDDLDDG